jgi:hypothetical protein
VPRDGEPPSERPELDPSSVGDDSKRETYSDKMLCPLIGGLVIVHGEVQR